MASACGSDADFRPPKCMAMAARMQGRGYCGAWVGERIEAEGRSRRRKLEDLQMLKLACGRWPRGDKVLVLGSSF